MVEVARYAAAVGVDEPTTPPAEFTVRIMFARPPKVSAPVVEKLEVAVVPKYALLAESCEVEALPLNCWRPVKIFAREKSKLIRPVAAL
jgi:hypothetical protein